MDVKNPCTTYDLAPIIRCGFLLGKKPEHLWYWFYSKEIFVRQIKVLIVCLLWCLCHYRFEMLFSTIMNVWLNRWKMVLSRSQHMGERKINSVEISFQTFHELSSSRAAKRKAELVSGWSEDAVRLHDMKEHYAHILKQNRGKIQCIREKYNGAALYKSPF